MKTVHCYVPSTHRIDLPGCHLVSNQPVRLFLGFTLRLMIHVIIAAVNIEEHDQILRQVLERANQKNIKFNFDKLQLHMNKVRYLGTMVTPQGINESECIC